MAEFPYLCFRHGGVDADHVDKCEEAFLWFERPLTASDRERIVATCPEPIGGEFVWGDNFVYFGSAGDTYDFVVVATYGPDWFKEALEAESYEIYDRYHEVIGEALQRFIAAVDNWLTEIHELVGIAFFSGLWVASPDSDWAMWSRKQAADARRLMDAEAEATPWLLDPGDTAENLVTAAKDETVVKGPRVARHLVESAPRSRVAEVFGWIYEAVSTIELEGEHEQGGSGDSEVVAQSAALIKQGKWADARELIDAYIEGGGASTPGIFANYSTIVRNSEDATTLLDMFEYLVRNNEELLTDPILIEDVVTVFRENGRAHDGIALGRDAVLAGMPWTSRVLTSLASSAFVTEPDSPWRAWVLQAARELKASDREMLDRNPWVYINLARLAAHDRRNDDAFADLAHLLDYSPGFVMHVLADEDLTPLHDDPRWKSISDG